MRKSRIDRRRFLCGLLGFVGSTAATGLYAWQIEPHWLQVRRRTMPLRGLAAAWCGRSLLQLSDLHIGREVADDYLRAAFAEARALEPDVVVVTGDLVTPHRRILAQVEPLLGELPRGRVTTIATVGNHDYGPRWRDPAFADRLCEVVAGAGIRVLRNERADLDGLELLGFDELWAGRFQPRPLTQARRASDPDAIALSHNPDTVDLPLWGGFRGWILAGHTHGGQCRPPFLPPPLLPVVNRRYVAGAYELGRGRQLYVNVGLGHSRQVRFNVRPEITLFELVRA